MKLTEQAREKFIELAGSHYDSDTNELKLVGDKYAVIFVCAIVASNNFKIDRLVNTEW